MSLELIRSLNRLQAVLQPGAEFLLGLDPMPARSLLNRPLHEILSAIKEGRLHVVIGSVSPEVMVATKKRGDAHSDYYADVGWKTKHHKRLPNGRQGIANPGELKFPQGVTKPEPVA